MKRKNGRIFFCTILVRIPFLSLRVISNSDFIDPERKEQMKSSQYSAEFTLELVKEIEKEKVN